MQSTDGQVRGMAGPSPVVKCGHVTCSGKKKARFEARRLHFKQRQTAIRLCSSSHLSGSADDMPESCVEAWLFLEPHLSCSVAPFFPLFFGGCPTKNGLPQKGFPFFQGHSLNK